MDEREVRCLNCHARGQFTGEQLLRLRAEDVHWLECEVCGKWFTSAEWAVGNGIFPEPVSPVIEILPGIVVSQETANQIARMLLRNIEAAENLAMIEVPAVKPRTFYVGRP